MISNFKPEIFDMERMARLQQLLEQQPGDSFLRHALALEYQKTGDTTAARDTFIALLEDNPEYTGSYYQLGKLLEQQGDTNGALEWYRKGMLSARRANDMHALGELRTAYDQISEDD